MDVLMFKEDVFDIRVTTEIDFNADTSLLGHYTYTAKPGNILVETGEWFEDLSVDMPLPARPTFFKPYANGEVVGSPDYRQYGMENFKRMQSFRAGEWHFIGVCVVVYKKGVALGSAALWNVESDYVGELKQIVADHPELIKEAIEKAQKNLAALLDSPDATANAAEAKI